MDRQSDVLGEIGLRFFGMMSAANAHEIKNALAVINENAGLLEDLVGMAEKGTPLDTRRLRRLAGTIKKQVVRADHIAKSSNRFSHSVDRDQMVADLGQALILVTDMATRDATLRDVHLALASTQASITLPVRPFFLLHLLWLCLHAAIKASRAGQALTVSGCRTAGAVDVRFGPLQDIGDSFVSNLGALPEMTALLHSLDSDLHIDGDAPFLLLRFNKKNNQS
jgi:signal transduction histidine kinase